MAITLGIHSPIKMTHAPLEGVHNDRLIVETEDASVDVYMPPHVAEATATTFNRMMQAVPTYQRGEYQYTTDRQIWFIDNHPGAGWRAQSDEITGDGDPPWLFAEGRSLLEVMDEIDAQERDNGCGRCASMPGLDNLHEIGRGKDMEMVCDDCATAEAKHQQAMHEMAEDDRAHAAQEATQEKDAAA